MEITTTNPGGRKGSPPLFPEERKAPGPGYYAEVYEAHGTYNLKYDKLVRFPVFVRMWQWLECLPRKKIIELGCGPGQLAQYLEDQGYTDYVGVDFCEKALEMGRKRCNQRFMLHDLRNGVNGLMQKGGEQIVIALELLEHLDNDVGLLMDIPENQVIMFSVPAFDEPGHVRWFRNWQQVRERYGKVINITNHHFFDSQWVAYGITKNRGTSEIHGRKY